MDFFRRTSTISSSILHPSQVLLLHTFALTLKYKLVSSLHLPPYLFYPRSYSNSILLPYENSHHEAVAPLRLPGVSIIIDCFTWLMGFFVFLIAVANNTWLSLMSCFTRRYVEHSTF